ncbi:MAG: phage tail protein [Phycisphaerales bacterium]|nr:phage tail protein [Phycisphaerales bacterium]
MSAANSYSAQGAILTIGTAAGAKTITAISKANPAVITSAAHGLADGTVVKISAVAGMTEINGKVGVVISLTANTFELRGVDSTNYTTYTSGGSATPSAARLGNWETWSGFDGQASDIDVTDLDSLAMEYRAGLQDNGQLTLGVQVSDTDDGQQALRGSLAAAGPASPFVITFKNGKTRSFQAYCKQFSEQGGVNQVVKGSVTCRITGAVTRG